MARKDWKKTPYTGNIPSWTNKKENYSIWVSYYDLVWNVDSEIGITHKFKTKNAAITFAKKYMRSH
jgi:hypothetical protein